MRLDVRNTFGLAADSAGAEGTNNVGDVIPLDVARDIGNGEPLYLVLQVETSFVGAGASVAFQVASDSAATIAVDGSQSVHYKTPAIGVANLTKGKVLAVVALPFDDYEEFVGLQAVVSGAAVSAGKVNAFLVRDVSAWKALPGNSW